MLIFDDIYIVFLELIKFFGFLYSNFQIYDIK